MSSDSRTIMGLIHSLYMDCPGCNQTLTAKTIGDITVEVCNGGCGGLWLDHHEIKKVDDSHEHLGEELLDIPKSPDIELNHSERRPCPECENNPLMQHFFSPKHHVEIDTCYNCAGIWLDCGELRQIRTTYSSEEEKNAALDVYFNDIMADYRLDHHEHTKEQTETWNNVINVLKFVSPSYYLPGKQDWGAF